MTPATPSTPSQRNVRDLPRTTWDAIVVGAGPAGSAAARRLALDGARVLLVDRRRLPRDKACGDALIPDALAFLRKNGLLARVGRLGHRSTRATIYSPWGAALQIASEAVTVRRELLDAELCAAAEESGAVPALATVTGAVDDGANGVEVQLAGDAPPLRAKFAILATGATASVLGSCGLLTRTEPSAVAIRAYLASEAEIDGFVVSFDRQILPGYAWIFPMGGGEYNVGCGAVSGESRLRALLSTFLEKTPVGRELARGERSRGAVRGAMIRYGLTGARPYGGGAVLAAGEAIGATYPMTGEGIGKSMETADLAATLVSQALRAGSLAPLAAYPLRLESELRPKYHAYEVAQRFIAQPWLAEIVFRRARRNRRLRDGIEGMLQESVDPTRVFSLRGLARAMVG
jgi:menaquinone-9 beta-reductase